MREFKRRFTRFAAVSIAVLGLVIVSNDPAARAAIHMASNSAPAAGYDDLVTNLRKNPVSTQDLQAKPNPAPVREPAPLSITARHSKPHQTMRTASVAHLRRARSHANQTAHRNHATDVSPASDTVTPYTDNFFHSTVSPY